MFSFSFSFPPFLLCLCFFLLSFRPSFIRLFVLSVSDSLRRHLLQFPLRPVYAGPPEIQNAKWKPHNKKLELSVPLDQSIFGSDSQYRTGEQKLAASVVDQPSTTLLAAGVIRDGALHLTQVQDVLQIRPSFQGTVFRGETVEDMEEETGEETKVETKKPLQQVS